MHFALPTRKKISPVQSLIDHRNPPTIDYFSSSVKKNCMLLWCSVTVANLKHWIQLPSPQAKKKYFPTWFYKDSYYLPADIAGFIFRTFCFCYIKNNLEFFLLFPNLTKLALYFKKIQKTIGEKMSGKCKQLIIILRPIFFKKKTKYIKK